MSLVPGDRGPLELLRTTSAVADPRLPQESRAAMARPAPLSLLHMNRMLIGRRERRLSRRVGQADIPLDTAQEALA